MKKHILTLFLVPALVLGLSFAFPPEDLPQTPYDESQGLAFDSTPRPARVLHDSTRAIQPIQRSAPVLSSYSPDWLQENRSAFLLSWVGVALGTSLDLVVPLRC